MSSFERSPGYRSTFRKGFLGRFLLMLKDPLTTQFGVVHHELDTFAGLNQIDYRSAQITAMSFGPFCEESVAGFVDLNTTFDHGLSLPRNFTPLPIRTAHLQQEGLERRLLRGDGGLPERPLCPSLLLLLRGRHNWGNRIRRGSRRSVLRLLRAGAWFG